MMPSKSDPYTVSPYQPYKYKDDTPIQVIDDRIQELQKQQCVYTESRNEVIGILKEEKRRIEQIQGPSNEQIDAKIAKLRNIQIRKLENQRKR